jgi:hypothetical protein
LEELTKANSPVSYLIPAVSGLYKNREKSWFLANAQQEKESNLWNAEVVKLRNRFMGIP